MNRRDALMLGATSLVVSAVAPATHERRSMRGRHPI